MTEDEIYRASTQFRLWNFTPDKLEEQRTRTNALAVEHVKTAIKRKKTTSQLSSANGSAVTSEAEGNGASNGADGSMVDVEVNCLTTGEEKKIVEYFCSNLLAMVGEFFQDLPINVTVSCISPLH